MPEERKPRAVIVAGSPSDKPHIDKITDSLNSFGVPYNVEICSAHKQLEDCLTLMRRLNEDKGNLVVIAVAGGTDALSGTLSWGLYHPVISCPPDGTTNQSPLHNPSGSSNAVIYRPDNIGRFVAQLYSHIPEFREAIERRNEAKLIELTFQGNRLRGDYDKKQGGSS